MTSYLVNGDTLHLACTQLMNISQNCPKEGVFILKTYNVLAVQYYFCYRAWLDGHVWYVRDTTLTIYNCAEEFLRKILINTEKY